MLEEVQELLNQQFDGRITKLEDTIDSMQNDISELKCDMKMLVNVTNRMNDRWEEYDQQMRKNKNDIIMKAILMVVGVLTTLVLVKLGLQ